MKENTLAELKKNYLVLEKKYSLQSFQELNEQFDIEAVAEKETDCLLREIRQVIMDKIVAYLRFTEMLINPSNAPIMFFSLVKSLDADEKIMIEALYEQLGNFELEVLDLDARYNEKKEADFIKKISEEWEEIAEKIVLIAAVLRRNFKNKSKKSERDYCG